MLYFITISSTLVIFSTVCLQEKATEWFRWFRSSCFPAQAITRCSFSLKHNLSCISLNFLTLISENFWILLAVWWLWNLRIPPKWQAGIKNVRACETPPWLAASLYHHSHQGCTLLSFSTWVCMCSESSCGKMQTKLTNWSLWMNHKKKTHSLANEVR